MTDTTPPRRKLGTGALIGLVSGAYFILVIGLFALAAFTTGPAMYALTPIFVFLFFAGVAVTFTAVVIRVAYRLTISAVRTGTLAAHEELARRQRGETPREWNTFGGRPAGTPAR